MSTRELRQLLEHVEDTRELVLGAAAGDRRCPELIAAWRAARSDAVRAYDTWCSLRRGDAYAAYRAAQDRADAAQDALAAAARSARPTNVIDTAKSLN